ncbi:methionine ABC transporter ATP-binding protein [Gordonibacter sp.]|uniref:methionine ABC transporter ATP-binding protein n=1 Tax=Gordonibacter sp. TaxID=1968902 RepID=UPI002FCC846B
MIQLEHLQKTYGATENAHHALRDVSLTIEDGDVFGIIGASGAGKSTLVRCINLLERPTGGRIAIDGRDVTNLAGKDLLELRASIGMIFQNFSLFQQRTVLGNVMFPLELCRAANPLGGRRTADSPGGRGERKDAAEKRAGELLELVGLSDKADRYPSQLSGGQQQRVAIARALANNPKVMLCDEATSALDTRTTVSILSLLKDINEELGVTMVVITHSLAVAQKICNRIAVIDEGRIVEEGFTTDVFSSPQSPVTRELIAYDTLSGEPGAWRAPEADRANKRLGDPAAAVLKDAIDSSTNPVVRIDGQVR